MQITIVSAGKIIPASELISATLRTDLVPIPASIEWEQCSQFAYIYWRS
ncbi:hypothetical protein ACT4Z6_16865 [Acinetobacter baumannii]